MISPKKHPNAITALLSGVGVGSSVVYCAQHWFGIELSPQTGLYVGTGVIAALLFMGRNGALGTWAFVKRIVLHGTNGK